RVRGCQGIKAMTNYATPENTAVICLLNYRNEEVPATYGFFYQSAMRVGIKVEVYGRGEVYGPSGPRPGSPHWPYHNSYEAKILRLGKHIESLPPNARYVLYVDARDTLFLRPLSDICDAFNRIGWPIVFGATAKNHPHQDPAWMERFKKYKSGFNYLNAGMFMAERTALENAFVKLVETHGEVEDDKIDSSATFLAVNDQHIWQAAYVEGTIPIYLDHKQDMFLNAHQVQHEDYDFTLSTEKTPIVMRSGAKPCVIHFPGHSSAAIPFAAWTLNLAALPASKGA
ncbi:MAG TPA: hypothetical protein VLK33_08505, partial [Terriglobales bacterium]|nr:hypothetical protein [Terriglobales bacterium]